MRIAWRVQMSLTGWRPGRPGGDPAFRGGTRIVRGSRVRLDGVRQNVEPSRGDDHGGSVRVFSGSTMPSVGLSRLCETPVLACSPSSPRTATPVVSLPVPAVVGMAKAVSTALGPACLCRQARSGNRGNRKAGRSCTGYKLGRVYDRSPSYRDEGLKRLRRA